ncbi:isopeptide-forming domain-containing fimbrial protein [Catenibacterium faecis]|uniref:Isopeptide-forming domain-containing fimbrial protein n=1 Tax=Catenibacterium faecis TaxID=2764323 RepID=A0ABR7KCM7_9FIRM|nr:isopeptide-forming domain-containing fimbrial protein [Catenibacterium faecis]MBC6010470.1 isopeptide-forming domain-containing fimbrial protein [Catenibacterium faecis]
MKLFKKLASFILAFAMVMAIAMPSVVMAVDNGSITITGAKAGHTFEAYQIFTGKVSGKTLSDIAWGSGVNKTGQNTLGSAKENAEKLKNETNAKDFAYEVAKYLGTAAGTSTRDGENYKIENLAPGYYLVKDKDGTVPKAETYTKFILKVVGTAEVKVKSEVPTSQKKVKDTNDTTGTTKGWQDSADYDIGDQVPFQLTGTVAKDFSDYKGAYKLVFHDKESVGLTFNQKSVVVKVDGTEIKSGYTVKTTGLEVGCSFEVVFDDLKQINSVHNGSVITVEYTSELNTKAEIGLPGNPNEMRMEFSNNPNVEQNGTTTYTPWDKVIVFTYKAIVNKKDSSNKPLTGAEFTLYKKYGEEWKKVEKVVVKSEDGTTFTFTGLDDGVYKLEETVTPGEYNTMDPIEFKIEATHDELNDNPELRTLSGNKLTGEVLFTPNTTEGTLETDVINYKGSELPSTGGMGTTILYVAGAVMILAAGAFLVMQKKAEDK